MYEKLTNEQFEMIRERMEVAAGNILEDSKVMSARDKLALEDVPKLLMEIERLDRIIQESTAILSGISEKAEKVEYDGVCLSMVEIPKQIFDHIIETMIEMR